MNERDYWTALEFRVSHELAGMLENHLRYLWCDGFIPEQYLLTGPSPRIIGRAWICDGPEQEVWEFTLRLKRPARSEDEIDWSSLLPPNRLTRWLAIDRAGRRIHIVPSAAVAGAAG